VHAKALARAAPEQLAVNGAGTAPVHALLVLGPQEDALGAGIALDHALGVVIGVMGQDLNGHVIAGIDLNEWLEQFAEIAPVDGVGRRWQVVMVRSASSRRGGLGDGRSDQRGPACCQGRGSAGCHEGAFQKTAPLGVKILE